MSVTNFETQSWPAWSELEHFEIINLNPHERAVISRSADRLKIVVVKGSVDVDRSNRGSGDVFDVLAEAVVEAGDAKATVVALHGHWSEETGGCGVFTAATADQPENRGTPVDYERTTRFDNHYHDCDEYWIFIEGEAVAVSEGTFFHVKPGDCIVTGAGDHHDLPDVTSPVRAVFFESTLYGMKRRGHLWEHTHGPAAPLRR